MEHPATNELTTQVPASSIAKVDRSHMTHEALAEVDACPVIDHHPVQAWADSLSAAGRKHVGQ